ncbi:MAG TPA: HAMP domain-containing sensor histidine kinase [Alteraurantiacibacter sp.]
MASGPPYIAEALSDGEDRLIEADEPLASLQLRCGGDLPGTIASPALLDLVRKSRSYGLRLLHSIEVQDQDEQITAFVEVSPDPESGGCRIGLAHWHAAALPSEDLALAADRRADIDRQLAELSGRLDPDQHLLSAAARTAELEPLAKAMDEGAGRPWTEFVELVGDHAGRSHHWRLLDGAPVRIEDSQRDWRVRLIPLGAGEPGSQGFELHLVAEQPLPIVPKGRSAARKDEFVAASLGREIVPVLRQPISRIIANAQTIHAQLAGPLADEYSNYAADIASAGEHLLSLLEDLADLEVIEDDEFSTAPDHIDLADVARRAGGILGMRAQEKGLTLTLPGEKASMPAIAEFRRVLQVLLNLIGNAIRYTPDGTRIEVKTRRKGEWAFLTVADNGEGIPPEQQQRIFEKFERLGRQEQGGTGLGLYISRQLARAMGGDLTVESEPGEGARFILKLPALGERRSKPR